MQVAESGRYGASGQQRVKIPIPLLDDRSKPLPPGPAETPTPGTADASPETPDLAHPADGSAPTAFIRSLLGAIALLWERRDPLRDTERRVVIRKLFPQGLLQRQFLARFAALMLLSTAIAALGILSDSTAAVIGAMLVAPLMVPVLGVAAAIVMGWPVRIIRHSVLIFSGAVLAVMLAALISFIVPGRNDPLPAELMARTSPNLLDLGVALAAGAAGAYGQVRRHAADALTGVAVAVALVPPLAVVGITLQLTEWQLALGALLLFLANVIGIVVSASATFIAAGFVPGRNPFAGNTSVMRGVRWAAVAVIIVVLPMQFGRGNVLPAADPTDEVTIAVEEFVAEEGTATEVVDVEVAVDDGVADIDVVVASSATTPPVATLARFLAERLQTPVQLSVQVVASDVERAIITDP